LHRPLRIGDQPRFPFFQQFSIDDEARSVQKLLWSFSTFCTSFGPPSANGGSLFMWRPPFLQIQPAIRTFGADRAGD
jgi:hypothetical protein